MAQVLKEFGDDCEFTFATPGGLVPQLEINGLGLPMHVGVKSGAAMISATAAQVFRFDVDTFRAKRPELVARRDSELARPGTIWAVCPPPRRYRTVTRRSWCCVTT
ncbi:hypothetical protein [Streptomyces stelliscabiei]|uniref:hypothetical protein n=1 Tax=Streptomyces stelliscabiei TaxID=146820 RepID=UPI002FF102BB